MNNPLRTDKQRELRDQLAATNALAVEAGVEPLILSPLARQDVKSAVRRITAKLSEISVAAGGDPISPPDRRGSTTAALSTLPTLVTQVTATVAEDAGGGGAPEWLPEGALAFFDPANEHYYADGQERTRDWFVTGSSQADWVMTANMLALFNQNHTHRFDIVNPLGGFGGQLFELFDGASYGESNNALYLYRSTTSFALEDYNEINHGRALIDNAANRIAFSMFHIDGSDSVLFTSSNGGEAAQSVIAAPTTWLGGSLGWGEEIAAYNDQVDNNFVYAAFAATDAVGIRTISAL